MLFDKFENEVIITGVIEAIDPIHIGSSGKNSLNPIEIDDAVLKDSRGLPLIPGSSLKGMVRSRFEAVLKSIDESKVCDFTNKNDKNCISEDEAKEIRGWNNVSDADKAQEIYSKCCDVCKLFGGREVAGRLLFKDCYFIGDSVNYEYRDGIKIDRETGAVANSAKFDYEIVPKGSKFDFYLIGENLESQQMNYLDFIIRELESGKLSIGGKTTRGMGRIRLTDVKKEVKTAEDYRKELGL